jgi:hypothetical protein
MEDIYHLASMFFTMLSRALVELAQGCGRIADKATSYHRPLSTLEWISEIEAARLTGMSTRSIRRHGTKSTHPEAGKLRSILRPVPGKRGERVYRRDDISGFVAARRNLVNIVYGETDAD